MKRKIVILATAVAVATLAVVGGIGCLLSGMDLKGNLILAAVVAALTALIGGFCFQRRLSYLPGAVLGALGLLLWILGPLNRSAEYLVWHITTLYDTGYGWGVTRWTQGSLQDAGGTLALCYVAAWVSLAVTRGMVKQKRNFLGTVAVLLPLLPCLVLTDTVPETGYLFVTLLCFVVLLLTQTVRDREPAQAARLIALLAAPVALALGLLLLLCPRETYTGQAGAQKLEDMIVSWFDAEISDDPVHTPPGKLSVAADVTAREVELTKVGPQDPGVQVVMQVQGSKSGTVYLRGSAYDRYDGVQWSISQSGWSRDGQFAPAAGKEQTLTITTNTPHQVLYLTYAPMDTPALQNGRLGNTRGTTEYTIRYGAPRGYEEAWDQLKESLPQEMRMYLTLPETTLVDAREYLRTSVGFPKETMSAGDIYRYAVTVGALVRNSAGYDLGTPEMPKDAKDFALWFLRESDTGYCVHYATATAVLLRAAGIPSRYVSGYLVKTQANTAVDVRHKNAHAWVEYYIPGVGWMMLESTASGGDSPVVVTQPQETTEPEETTQVTTQPAEVETTQEPTEAPAVTGPREEPTQSSGGGWIVPLALVGAMVALLVQWRLRVSLRRRNYRKGKPNAQALNRWREVALCARLLGVKPDPQLHALAQKAKFSRETITPQELRQFEQYLQSSRDKLKKKPLWNQLVYTLIFALY